MYLSSYIVEGKSFCHKLLLYSVHCGRELFLVKESSFDFVVMVFYTVSLLIIVHFYVIIMPVRISCQRNMWALVFNGHLVCVDSYIVSWLSTTVGVHVHLIPWCK